MSSISIPEQDEDTAYDDERQREVDEKSAQRGSADADGTPALSASIAHLIVNKSALHAWTAHPRLNPRYQPTESAEFDYGRAAHKVLLEGEDASIMVIEADDWRKKEAKALRDQARADRKIPILARQMNRVRAMVKVARDYLFASELSGLMDDGEPEHSIKWEETTALCRARLDWISGDRKIVMDYKTTTSAKPESFIGQAIGYGYAMQEAFYRRGVKAVYGQEPRFVFLLQEKELPYACSLVAFDPAMQEMGDRQAEYAISLWRHAMQTGKWHGYTSRVAYIEPPVWYAARAEEIDFDNIDERMNP